MFVLQYVRTVANGIATLTPTREWQDASKSVITALGANTVAHRRVRSLVESGMSQQEALQSVFVLNGGEAPTIVVPNSMLSDASIAFRVSKNGKSHAAKIAVRNAQQSFDRKAGKFVSNNRKELKKFGLTF